MEFPHLNHPNQRSENRRTVQWQLTYVDLGDSEMSIVVLMNQHKEYDERDDGEHEHENTDKESLMSASTINRVVMRRSLQRMQFPSHRLARTFVQIGTIEVSPHDVENGSADQWVLDGAGKQEWWSVLHQVAENVRTTAFEDIVRAFEASRYPRMVVNFLQSWDDMLISCINYTGERNEKWEMTKNQQSKKSREISPPDPETVVWQWFMRKWWNQIRTERDFKSLNGIEGDLQRWYQN